MGIQKNKNSESSQSTMHFFYALLGVALIFLLWLTVFNRQALSVTPLTLQVDHYQGAGGTITSSPSGINCGSDCSEVYSAGQTVVLTATASSGRTFSAWSPGQFCSEPSNFATTCTVTVPAEGLDIQALWGYDQYDYSVSKVGSGSGRVTGPGINCGTNCTSAVSNGSWANLTATASAGSEFVGWDSGGTVCNSGSTGPTCNIYGGGSSNPGLVAVARFELASSDSSQDSSGSQSEESEELAEDAESESDEDRPPVPEAHLKDASGNALLSLGTVPIVFSPGQDVFISGATVPNGQVKLFIFSDPQTAEVTADAKGLWEYTITGLGNGGHRVEAEVTDPETGNTSQREQILAFQVGQDTGSSPQNTAATYVPEDSSERDYSTLTFIALGAVILFGGAGFWLHKKHKKAAR